jgi:benzoyl-CoA reductase/2-hydroxyglutaryl-CoA dehydratase subunit BcrC/BadD/HgdB
MSNIAKANKLRQAYEKLHEADALMQEALGASDECYDLHCAIENVADDIAEMAEQLEEMQITD